MCTALTLNNNKIHLFGRNLDIEADYGWSVVITPRKFSIPLRFHKAQDQKYAVIGMGMVILDQKSKKNYPLYAEAANEEGLAIAGLNFPRTAFYPKPGTVKGAFEVTPFELIPFILSSFKTVKEVKAFIEKNNLQIVDEPFSPQMLNSPLHFIIADKTDDSIVLEPCKDGLKVYDNKLGILTNNPTFDWQMTNLSFYQNLHQKQTNDAEWYHYNLQPFGQGFASYGLPGDWTPPSRFVKTAFLKATTDQNEDDENLIAQFFHILDNVSMVKGGIIVQTPNNKEAYDITLYSSCINLEESVYYYKTYKNNQINVIDLKKEKLDTDEIKTFKLVDKQSFNFVNK